MAKASTKNKSSRGWFSSSPKRRFLLSKDTYSRVEPFTGTGKFDVNYNKNGHTINAPVNQELVRVANGTHEPKFWEEVISKWRAYPASKRTGVNADKNLRALVRREYNKTYGPKTVYKTRATKTTDYSDEFKKLSKELKDLKKKDKVQVQPKAKTVNIVETASPQDMRYKAPIDVPMAMASDVAIERMKTQDTYGRALKNTPEAVAAELNIPPDKLEKFEQVRTRQASQDILNAADIPFFTAYRRRVQGGMQSGVRGVAS